MVAATRDERLPSYGIVGKAHAARFKPREEGGEHYWVVWIGSRCVAHVGSAEVARRMVEAYGAPWQNIDGPDVAPS